MPMRKKNMTDYKDNFMLTDVKPTIMEHLSDIKHLLEQTYWAKERDMQTIETSVKYSLCYGIFDVERDVMVGFARIITDYATMYYLTDVVVDKEYRGQDLGKWMLDWILKEEIKLKGYGLLKTKEAQELYVRYGFEECEATCMVRL